MLDIVSWLYTVQLASASCLQDRTGNRNSEIWPEKKQETGQVFFGSIFQTGNRTGLLKQETGPVTGFKTGFFSCEFSYYNHIWVNTDSAITVCAIELNAVDICAVDILFCVNRYCTVSSDPIFFYHLFLFLAAFIASTGSEAWWTLRIICLWKCYNNYSIKMIKKIKIFFWALFFGE